MSPFVLVHNGRFWTGDRFSDHIGEAFHYATYRKAHRIASRLAARFEVHITIIPISRLYESPNYPASD